jgi:tocopherol O-methyltransferase
MTNTSLPLPLNQSIQQFYDASSSLWEQIWGEHMHHGYYGADGQEKKERRQAQIDLIEELLHWGNIQQATQILDVGCGIGGSSLYLAEKFQAAVTGITLSPVQASRATERAQELAISLCSSHSSTPPSLLPLSPSPAAQFLVADALHMPFVDDSFDLVWSLESGEHMPDKAKFLQECYRVLKPGGTLLFVTWCHRPIDRQPLTTQEQRHLEDIYRVYCLPYVISLPEYEAIAQFLNFKNIRTADWSTAVAPFWDSVIDSALTPGAIWGLLRSGWTTIQAALSLGLMKRGYETGLVRFGLLTATK